ncbi:OmpA family protein [Thermomonas carbonis]|uniref:OmpA family protein n=1 Tax=Thermomonas carbonis TaxID=1463158 RepID=A0A7G9SPH9_9GAMM|nr:OmpA family protein [Thermomonas carbonis]QNN69754.1 OmpA family protein [Thermomonas carbonis]GHB95288.1 hypothetical protein GCM10010080_03400 [Thermomonas carbonis]
MLIVSFPRRMHALACCLLLALAACKPQQSTPVADVAAATPAALPVATQPAEDQAWPAPDKVERDGPDAELMVQIGDLDNFGFGFPKDFDPFTGKSTPPHAFPFQPGDKDARGTDRIMVVSGHKAAGGDGYTGTTERPGNLPQSLRVVFELGDIKVAGAALQLFVDDFQAPVWGTRYQARINGVEVPLLATTLNALDQTGPIGKLITVQLLPEQLALLRDGKLEVAIDDPANDVADGFAFDFARLLINPKPWRHAGTIHGIAVDKASGEPLAGVLVSTGNTRQATTSADGGFLLEGVPAGLAVVSGSHPDYQADTEAADLVSGERIDVRLELEPSAKTGESLGEQLDKQGKVDLYGIYFDTDKAVLKDESTAVLEQVLALLEARSHLQLIVGGHTDAEGGDTHNQALSARRAEAVVAWLVERGVDTARLRAEGHGEARPVANNDSGEGRALNRRVELRDASEPVAASR